MPEDVVTYVTSQLMGMRDTTNRHVVCGISGIDGAGKSTFVETVIKHLSSQTDAVVVIGIDDFYNLALEALSTKEFAERYYEQGFEFGRLKDILKTIRRNTEIDISYEVVDIATGRKDKKSIMASGKTIFLVEGVFLFRPILREVFDIRIWIESTMERALKFIETRERDLLLYKNREAVRERYSNGFFVAQSRHIRMDRPEASADMIILPGEEATELRWTRKT